MPHRNKLRSPAQIAPPLRCFVTILVGVAFVGCEAISNVMGSTWHEKFNWNAEEYFDDPKVIALCRAIEANDIAEIDRQVAAGANVNAKGKGNMTPLLWAFPDNKLERFERLLEHGADPNVIVDSDFGTRSAIMPGESVTHMASGTAFPGYFEAVFKHGGDPNLVKKAAIGNGDTPIFSVLTGRARGKEEKVQTLVEKGANLDHVNGSGTTPTMLAVGWFGQYDIALMLLKAGADHKVHKPKSNSRLIHILLSEKERRSSTWTPQQKADYQVLVEWLVDHGESVEEAKQDRDRWRSWKHFNGEYRRKMDAEIAERKAREQVAAQDKNQE